jgi:hypothetical protein
MVYHENFWVAVAAAAPVIALANTVSIADAGKIWYGSKSSSRSTKILFNVIVYVSIVNYAAQAAALTAALNSLNAGRVMGRPEPVIAEIIYGLLSICFITNLGLILRSSMLKLGIDPQEKPIE